MTVTTMADPQIGGSNFHLQILERQWSHPDSEYLRNLQRLELAKIYGRPDGGEPGKAPSAEDISVLVVAYVVLGSGPSAGADGSTLVPIACGALRTLSKELDPVTGVPYPGDAEIKRMYVHHEYRGKPFYAAKAVLAELENRARGEGWSKLVLETGNEQKAAIKFYEREGYTQIPKFGAYVASGLSLCYGKNI